MRQESGSFDYITFCLCNKGSNTNMVLYPCGNNGCSQPWGTQVYNVYKWATKNDGKKGGFVFFFFFLNTSLQNHKVANKG